MTSRVDETSVLPSHDEWQERRARFQRWTKPGFFPARASVAPEILTEVVPEFQRIARERAALIARELNVVAENQAAQQRRDAEVERRKQVRADARLSGESHDLPPLRRRRVESAAGSHAIVVYEEPDETLEPLPYPENSPQQWNELHSILENEERCLMATQAEALIVELDKRSVRVREADRKKLGALQRAQAAYDEAHKEVAPFDEAQELLRSAAIAFETDRKANDVATEAPPPAAAAWPTVTVSQGRLGPSEMDPPSYVEARGSRSRLARR